MPMLLPPSPIYLDWTFWAAVFSLVAIILSQLPPVHLLLRPKRLEVEVCSRIRISHKAGNPNAGLVVSVRNTGGRALRIRSLCLRIARDGEPLLTLSGKTFFETATATTPVLFVPFNMRPGDDWSHSVMFFNDFDRLTEKNFRQCMSTLSADIRQKIAARKNGDEAAVVADPKLVEPFLKLFGELFVWKPGEYVATLDVLAEPGSASFSKKYRFTLYESDTRDLEAFTDDYKLGGGIIYTVPAHNGVDIPLAEHVG